MATRPPIPNPRRRVVAVVAALLAGGCGGGPTAGVADLGECPPLPAGITAPADVEVPAGTVVTDVAHVDPLVQVTGLIDATPVEVRDAYADRADVVHVEDEGFEAEVLLSTATHRTYLRAQARCATGSVITVVRAPEDAAGRLPVPGQVGG
ncbi:hypothetical protein [Euzebya sp.]|uniref:hypothetical protein n=1 Tax=Euzebya sp. TaxID=1971409 RepID=UPI0035148D6D